MIELFTDYRQSGQGTGPCPAFSIFFKNICQKSVSDSSGDKQLELYNS